MPRIVSSQMLNDMYAQQTGEAVLILLEMDHPDMPSPVRITSDAVGTISNGDTYVAFPFDFILPDEPENGRPPKASIRICNIRPEDPEEDNILDALRDLQGKPSIKPMIVRGSDPDTVEIEYPGFQLNGFTYDALYVQGDLSLKDLSQEPFPAHSYTPSFFAALF